MICFVDIHPYMKQHTYYHKSVIAEQIFHKIEKRKELISGDDTQNIELVKTITGSRWNNILNVWYVPLRTNDNDTKKPYLHSREHLPANKTERNSDKPKDSKTKTVNKIKIQIHL